VLNSIFVDDDGGDAGGGDLELYGNVTAQAEGTVSLFSKGSSNYVVIREGSFFGQPIAESILNVVPQPGQLINLRANLTDEDDFSGDDTICSELVATPFETARPSACHLKPAGDATSRSTAPAATLASGSCFRSARSNAKFQLRDR
jgi:hypothetical protein